VPISAPIRYVPILRLLADGEWKRGEGIVGVWQGGPKDGYYAIPPTIHPTLVGPVIDSAVKDKLVELRLRDRYAEYRLTDLGKEALLEINR
jgi:hypothetical protein